MLSYCLLLKQKSWKELLKTLYSWRVTKNILDCVGDMDFTTSTWIQEFTQIQTITRTVDGNTFTIVYDGDTVTINGFPVTVNDWDTVIKGETVTLRGPRGKTATLTFKKNTVYFNNQPLTGNSVSISITIGSTGSQTPTSSKNIKNLIYYLYLD